MDYQQMYQNKLTTAASAANVIQSGDWVITAGVSTLRLPWIKK